VVFYKENAACLAEKSANYWEWKFSTV
jgi:hypothetical protein